MEYFGVIANDFQPSTIVIKLPMFDVQELLDTPLDSLLTYLNKETSKFEWTPDNIRIEKISRFLEQHKPHFEFDSRSFNFSMPKEISNGVIGERDSMQSTDVKYQFNQIFPTNTPRVFHVETTWKQTFPRRFNVEYTWSVCKVFSLNKIRKKMLENLISAPIQPVRP